MELLTRKDLNRLEDFEKALNNAYLSHTDGTDFLIVKIKLKGELHYQIDALVSAFDFLFWEN